MMSVTNPGVYSVLGFKLDPLFAWFPPLRGGFAAAHSIGFVLYLAVIAAFIAVWLWRRSPRSVPETMLQFGSLVFFVPVYLSPTPVIAYWSYATAHGLQYLLFLGFHATGWSYGLGRNPARKWPKGVLGLASLVVFAISVVVLLRTQQSLPAPFRAAIGSAADWLGSPSPHAPSRAAVWASRSASRWRISGSTRTSGDCASRRGAPGCATATRFSSLKRLQRRAIHTACRQYRTPRAWFQDRSASTSSSWPTW
jgi:hypothetical protein